MHNRLNLRNAISRGPRAFSQGHHNNGFTLIEVLVTVVVVSIGLLGLAGLQINGLRANMSSEARSKATLLASDIVERMRANTLGVAAGAYNVATLNAASCAAAPTACGNTGSADIGTAVTCTANQMAAFDLWEWGCGTAAVGVHGGGVSNLLSAGTASVVCADLIATDSFPCTPGSPNTITVSWDERAPSATGTVATGAATTQAFSLTVVP